MPTPKKPTAAKAKTEAKAEPKAKPARKPPAIQAGAEKSAALKAAAKSPPKPATKVEAKPAAPAVPAMPTVNTDNSAAAAAAYVAHKIPPTAPPTTSGEPKQESAMFRHMKESLNRPHSQIMGGLLDKIGSNQPKKSGSSFTNNKQVGQGQTFGADASRRNVPRRTGG
jgi:hypothetical protein